MAHHVRASAAVAFVVVLRRFSSEDGRVQREAAAVREFLGYLGIDFSEEELIVPSQWRHPMRSSIPRTLGAESRDAKLNDGRSDCSVTVRAAHR